MEENIIGSTEKGKAQEHTRNIGHSHLEQAGRIAPCWCDVSLLAGVLRAHQLAAAPSSLTALGCSAAQEHAAFPVLICMLDMQRTLLSAYCESQHTASIWGHYNHLVLFRQPWGPSPRR